MSIFNWKKEDLSLGQLGEKVAVKYLKKKGYKILETNFFNPYGKRLGEIDIVAGKNKEKEIVFIEVKTRKLGSYQSALPEENITPRKLHRLNKIANFYLKSKGLWDKPYYFDAISVWISQDQKTARVKHFENIFI